MRKDILLSLVAVSIILIPKAIGHHDSAHDNTPEEETTMNSVAKKPSSKFYTFSAKSLSGDQVDLSKYRDKVLLVVNTASKCGFTPQYKGLKELYQKYNKEGFEILGFPCNQFGAQEPGAEDEIAQFCSKNYGVTFQMFSKIDVNGSDTLPLYEYMKDKARGALNTKAIKWNFTKFLVDAKGNVLKRYAPNVKPADLSDDIEKLLKK